MQLLHTALITKRLTRTPRVGGQEFESQDDQILHSMVNGSPPLKTLTQITGLLWRYDAEKLFCLGRRRRALIS